MLSPLTEAPQLKINLDISPQPTDTSCGPTCLHALYKYYNHYVKLPQLIEEIPSVEGGGTLAVFLGIDALKRGFNATIYTYNLKVFDPTWFQLGQAALKEKLQESLHSSKKPLKIQQAIKAYIHFLKLGGEILSEDLSAKLIRKHLKLNRPILTGLSATFLYQTKRELPDTNQSHDLNGQPTGHFVLLCGYNTINQEVYVADPYACNPLHNTSYYAVRMERLITSILLGIYTYDGNLLIIHPTK